MAQPSKNPVATNFGIWFGAAFVVMGAGMMALMGFSPKGLKMPLWVAEIAAATFVFAGLSFIAQSKSWRRLQRICALGVVYGLAVPGLWIMLGPDTGSCSATLGFFSRTAGNTECRLVFGAGGIVTLIFALAMTFVALRKPQPKIDP